MTQYVLTVAALTGVLAGLIWLAVIGLDRLLTWMERRKP